MAIGIGSFFTLQIFYFVLGYKTYQYVLRLSTILFIFNWYAGYDVFNVA